MLNKHASFSDLIGKILTTVDVNRDKNEILFHCDDGTTYRMYHEQDCCEDVYIEDICGELNDLLGYPIFMAEEVSNNENPKDVKYDESFTWTFYKIENVKGYVTIRWYGTSNGYYSESVEFERV